MTNADRLHGLYRKELRESLRMAIDTKVSKEQTERLLRASEELGPRPAALGDGASWIWSDLHLGHEPSRIAFRRPFASAAAADDAMMNAWYEEVGDNETIVCLGDVTVDGEALAYHQEWWTNAPGTKWLVLGNHDVDPVNRRFETDRTDFALYAEGDPPLLLTHVPLQEVPAGTVNVHGHLHGQEGPTEDRHVNVSVEQLNYRPVRLSAIRRLAQRLVQGRNIPGRDTRARLILLERLIEAGRM